MGRRSSSRQVILARHYKAARIQRAWRISRWRRLFVQYSRVTVQWLGSLSWLQQHNKLYGTELADAKDVMQWEQHRAHALLDYEVDPWGSHMLRTHLSQMWLGAASTFEERPRAADAAGVHGAEIAAKSARTSTTTLQASRLSSVSSACQVPLRSASLAAPPRGQAVLVRATSGLLAQRGPVLSRPAEVLPLTQRSPLISPRLDSSTTRCLEVVRSRGDEQHSIHRLKSPLPQRPMLMPGLIMSSLKAPPGPPAASLQPVYMRTQTGF